MIVIAYLFKAAAFVLGLTGIIACGVLVWRAVRRAPDGYEDAQGFHFTRPLIETDRNLSPQGAPQPAVPVAAGNYFTRHKIHP